MPGWSISRRRVVGLLGGSVALAPAIAKAFTARAEPLSSGLSADGAADRSALLAPLCEGSRLRGWNVTSISPLVGGAVTVALASDDGHAFHLEVLARDGSPLASKPPAQTARFAVFVRNEGDGWVPTVEEQGLAAMALGAIVQRNEGSADASGFLTHAERLAKHGDALLPT